MNNQIIYKGNVLYQVKSTSWFIGVEIFALLIIIFSYFKPTEVPPMITLLSFLLLILLVPLSFIPISKLVGNKQGMILDSDGITYFGKHIISWNEIEYARTTRQTDFISKDKLEIVDSVSSNVAGIGAVGGALLGGTTGGAIGGGIGGGLGAVKGMENNIELVIKPLDPESYIGRLGFFSKMTSKTNNSMTGNKGEVIYLNISPMLIGTENLLGDISKNYGVKVK